KRRVAFFPRCVNSGRRSVLKKEATSLSSWAKERKEPSLEFKAEKGGTTIVARYVERRWLLGEGFMTPFRGEAVTGGAWTGCKAGNGKEKGPTASEMRIRKNRGFPKFRELAGEEEGLKRNVGKLSDLFGHLL
ncbi:hypothetical protein LINGRAPRIM_LOCUS19, partial [Linum grandiflorum]